MKKELCYFTQVEIIFMAVDHHVGGGKIHNGCEVCAIKEWQAPTKVAELRSFLSLVNYYSLFTENVSTPLT